MAHHEQTVGGGDEWYTPPYIFEAMAARFDLDVAHPGLHVVDWVPADRVMTTASLSSNWQGFVWCNPPFGGRNGIAPWLDKFFEHGNGVCLTPDRTSASWWRDAARKADLILFVSPKVKFIRVDGRANAAPSTGTTLMAKGPKGIAALLSAEVAGLGIVR